MTMLDEDRHSDPGDDSHTYDGIVENNHPLPGWWQWTLYGAIVFAVIYWFDMQALHIHPSQREIHDAQVAAERMAMADQAFAQGAVNDELLLAFSRDPATLAQGKATFTSTCVACHRADGGGSIGPNLTDAYWLHGNKPGDVFKTVREGVVAKGMPAWGPQLGDKKIAAVAAYVLTIEHTNVPGGKAPQGAQMD
ncbi:c-type cytochrome [Pendulispora brunnea]|uniref:C-type cytochrome n=1 Tax=Pendulispora brunnea TaxID=2905690 RepID=A0ABZ2K3E1_9BACT